MTSDATLHNNRCLGSGTFYLHAASMTSTPTRRLIIDHQSFRLVAALPGEEQARGAGAGVHVRLKKLDRSDGAEKNIFVIIREREGGGEG